MKYKHRHKILIVESDPREGETLENLLGAGDLEIVISKDGPSAIDYVQNTSEPFSLVICIQEIKGIPGIQVLEQIKQISPDTQRFLLTTHFDIEMIINAVNNGTAQRFIIKPWDESSLIKAVRTAVKQFEVVLENERLMTLAKKQNTELFELNCELVENTKQGNKKRSELEIRIQEQEKKAQSFANAPPDPSEAASAIFKTLSSQSDNIDSEKINAVFALTLKKLYSQMNDLAGRRGFEMAPPKGRL